MSEPLAVFSLCTNAWIFIPSSVYGARIQCSELCFDGSVSKAEDKIGSQSETKLSKVDPFSL